MNVEIFLFGLFFSLHKPVARIFYGAVQSKEETDRTSWEGEGGGGGWGGVGVIRLSENTFRLCLKTGYFFKLSIFKSNVFQMEYFTYSFFRMAMRDVSI